MEIENKEKEIRELKELIVILKQGNQEEKITYEET
jgi:hypothetical protein